MLWIFAVFFVLSLGKDLSVLGYHILFPMPYDVLERILPVIKMGGVPTRFTIISIFAISMLAAFGVHWIINELKSRIALLLVLIMVFLELIPRPIPSTPVEFPPYIEFLIKRTEQTPGAVIDIANGPGQAMVYQTRHKQPIQTGYLARLQPNVSQNYSEIKWLVDQQKYLDLRLRYEFRYIVTFTIIPDLKLLFDGPVRLYEISSSLVEKKTLIDLSKLPLIK